MNYDSDFDSSAQSPNTLNLTDGDFSKVNKQLFNVGFYNVNSITFGDRINQLYDYCRKLNLSILGICESKLDDTISTSIYSIPGYNLEHLHRNRHGGGILCYIHESLPYVRRQNLEVKSKEIEQISIDVTIKNKIVNINILYRPPDDHLESQNEFLNKMNNTLAKLKRHTCNTRIILGDFNFGNCYNFHSNLSHKPLDNKAPELFEAKGFQQIIDIPTRHFNNSVSLIDLIFFNSHSNLENLVLSATLPPIADHCGTLCSLNTLTFKQSPKKCLSFDYQDKDINWKNLCCELDSLNDIKLYSNSNIDWQVDNFTRKLIQIRNKYIPNKEVTIRPKDNPWFDKDVRKLLRKKNRLFKKYKILSEDSKQNTQTLNNTFSQYKEASKNYDYTARKTKRKYFNNLRNVMGNPNMAPKKKFELIERITNTGKNSNIPPLIDNDEVISNPKIKAKVFNAHFASKSTIINSSDKGPHLEEVDTHSKLDKIYTSKFELGPHIKEMKVSHQSPCGIPSAFLKILYERTGSHLTNPMTKLFNNIFKHGIWPTLWKTANITPIYKKKGPKTDKKNFRPISILSTLSKICEAIIHDRLLGHLSENNLISERQGAYLKGDSTTNQLLYLNHKIRLAWTKGLIAHTVFLDISAAFDCVWHNGLLSKLNQIQIKGTTLKLLGSYLTDRRAKTIVDGQSSDELQIIAGVPQGSRLGPLLFIININDLIDNLNTEGLIYADDTTLVATGTDTYQTTTLLNEDLNKIHLWSLKWKIKFNADKSKDIIFSKMLLNNSPPLMLNQSLIDRVGMHKHLGLTLKPDLSWDSHLSNIRKQVNLKLSILYRVKDLERKIIDLMYKSMVRSHIDYVLPVFGPSLSNKQIETLEKLQYRAARLTTGAMIRTSGDKMYKDLGWETIKTRILFLSLCLFRKIHTNATRPLIRKCLPQTNLQKQVRTRQDKLVNSYYYNEFTEREAFFQNSFFPKITKLYDRIPNHIKNTSDFSEFKERLYIHLRPKKMNPLTMGLGIPTLN